MIIEISLEDLIMISVVVLLATVLALFVVGAFAAGLGLGAVLVGGKEVLRALGWG